MPTYPHFRPDTSGVRGGVDRKTRPSAQEFPYDRNTGHYGKNMAKATGQSSGGADGGPKLTPRDTEHTVWEEIAEALGIPFSFHLSNKAGRAANFTPGLDATGCACGPSAPCGCHGHGGRVDQTPSDSDVEAAGRAGVWEELMRFVELLVARSPDREVGERDDDAEIGSRGDDRLPAHRTWRGLNPPEEDR